ncbi:MAG: flavodoxin [Anaerolineaceae bacterium]
MRKLFALFVSTLILLTITACGSSNSPTGGDQVVETPTTIPAEIVRTPDAQEKTLENSNTPTAESTVSAGEGEPQTNSDTPKILIAYFSHTGNTRTIAEQIHANVNSDLFEIVTVNPYPDDYDTLVDLAKQEQNENARPALSTHVEDMDSYDVIFIGYPNWWGTMPMPVFTFLEEYNFSGKTIIPFCTHAGSGLGHSESDIAGLLPDATLLKGLAIRGSSVDSGQAQQDVTGWLRELGFVE